MQGSNPMKSSSIPLYYSLISLKRGAIWIFFTLMIFLSQGCSVRMKAITAEEFNLDDRISVYDEEGRLMPHPDCLAYAKFGVQPTGDLVEDLIVLGKRYLGKPYRYRGAAPWAFDCSGFVRFLYGSFGIPLPASSAAISEATTTVEDPMPGDLLFFKGTNRRSNRVGHVAILIEIKKNGAMVMLHSTNSRGIIIEELGRSSYFRQRYLGAKRIPKLYRYFDAKKLLQEQDLNSKLIPPVFYNVSITPAILMNSTACRIAG